MEGGNFVAHLGLGTLDLGLLFGKEGAVVGQEGGEFLLGGIGLAAFLWSLRSGQYRDLDGDAARILFSNEDAPPDDRQG